MIHNLFDVPKAIFYRKRYKDKHTVQSEAKANKRAQKILKIEIFILAGFCCFCAENYGNGFMAKYFSVLILQKLFLILKRAPHKKKLKPFKLQRFRDKSLYFMFQNLKPLLTKFQRKENVFRMFRTNKSRSGLELYKTFIYDVAHTT